jgi:hypothetical protein
MQYTPPWWAAIVRSSSPVSGSRKRMIPSVNPTASSALPVLPDPDAADATRAFIEASAGKVAGRAFRIGEVGFAKLTQELPVRRVP